MIFKNKKLLITGGTGSFGNAVLNRLINLDLSEILIFSRDEKKQDDMRKKYSNNKLKFIIGDVRDYSSIKSAVASVDYIFHAAALKQVPSCEFYPLEALKTNVLGTENVINAAISANVKKIICLSTDKAVYPINAMGISKAMMEKVVIAKSRSSLNTKICITRYGNVMASRGSVIPLFVDQIKNNRQITITNPNMTRFMMTLEDAVELVMFAFSNGNNGDILIQKSPGTTIKNIAKQINVLLDNKNPKYSIIGTRHGEKLHEVLLSSEEFALAHDLGNYYRVSVDNRDLNYEKYIINGDVKLSSSMEYSSDNTHQLNDDELKELLLKTKLF